MKETWKDIPGYEGLYQVSDLGRVRSLDRVMNNGVHGYATYKGRVLKVHENAKGYLKADLSKDGRRKTIKVHQLVAMAFLGHKRCGMKLIVDHIDNNRKNNRVDNLQLITNRENLSKDKSGSTSKYTGVSWSKRRKKWTVQIKNNGKSKYLGSFDSEYDAHLAYQNELAKISA